MILLAPTPLTEGHDLDAFSCGEPGPMSASNGVRWPLLVHALHDKARAFYLRYGFQESPLDPMTLLLPLR